MPRIHRAHGDTVGEQRERQSADFPHDGQLRKEHLARVVDEHTDACDEPDEAGVLIGAHLLRAGQAQ